MIQVVYNGVDITDSVAINRCYHDMYAEGRADSLNIRFNDTAHMWDKWQPKTDDMISIVYGASKTGRMYITDTTPQNGLYEIQALSAPSQAFCRRYKAWAKVTLTQIAQEIAARYGLAYKNYGASDYLYEYILQSNESDLAFLHRRCILESCAFLIYDGTLVLYSQPNLENASPLEVFTVSSDADYHYRDKSSELYGSCRLECGGYVGEYTADAENARVLFPPLLPAVGSSAEAIRFSRGLLRDANKTAYSGYINSAIIPHYAAASVILISNARAPLWDGNAFLTHIRNIYSGGQSKMFFRKPLGGY